MLQDFRLIHGIRESFPRESGLGAFLNCLHDLRVLCSDPGFTAGSLTPGITKKITIQRLQLGI